MIELTHEQDEALSRKGLEPFRAIDPATNLQYVLVRAGVYDRLKALLDDDLPDSASLMNEVMAEDDANDPYLESYRHLAQKAQ